MRPLVSLHYFHHLDAQLILLEELWKALCFLAYPLTAEQHYIDEDPESWRDAYFVRGPYFVSCLCELI